MENESPFVKPSPLPDLSRKQLEKLEQAVSLLQGEAKESKRRDRVQLRFQLITLAIAIATLVAAIAALRS
jgi:hypothetical protein